MILPAITLYQPWATWIIRGWKTIETREHNRFACLKGKMIFIHAGMHTDQSAFRNPYLTREQLQYRPEEMVNGFILGNAFVKDVRLLTRDDEPHALIECQTPRYGLILENIVAQDHPLFPVKGEMGIWYFDVKNLRKVKKRNITT